AQPQTRPAAQPQTRPAAQPQARPAAQPPQSNEPPHILQAEPAAHNPQQGPVPQTPPGYQAQGYGWQPLGYNPQQGPVPQTPPGYQAQGYGWQPPGYNPQQGPVPQTPPEYQAQGYGWQPPGYNPQAQPGYQQQGYNPQINPGPYPPPFPPRNEGPTLAATLNQLRAVCAPLARYRAVIVAALFLAAVVGAIVHFSGDDGGSSGGNNASSGNLSKAEKVEKFANEFEVVYRQFNKRAATDFGGGEEYDYLSDLDDLHTLPPEQLTRVAPLLRDTARQFRDLDASGLSKTARKALDEFLDELEKLAKICDKNKPSADAIDACGRSCRDKLGSFSEAFNQDAASVGLM
ncbi:MAG: hypothetical protein IKY61_05590, partial [Thermoguttaceae bacterium]|nr:hypothetical protein [Thermoguttaceae bacterium]